MCAWKSTAAAASEDRFTGLPMSAAHHMRGGGGQRPDDAPCRQRPQVTTVAHPARGVERRGRGGAAPPAGRCPARRRRRPVPASWRTPAGHGSDRSSKARGPTKPSRKSSDSTAATHSGRRCPRWRTGRRCRPGEGEAARADRPSPRRARFPRKGSSAVADGGPAPPAGRGPRRHPRGSSTGTTSTEASTVTRMGPAWLPLCAGRRLQKHPLRLIREIVRCYANQPVIGCLEGNPIAAVMADVHGI